ncbi:competence/damage-inducible protein A [Thiohalophilus sp.]|uniref:competence/damage-inducible protein A n=1 Tax=Thiohalophilus sp. TaxID=3028392 RepID=UPI002ACE5B48|nr:molybdopterin-binding protein [Thiohalophilus sp.]MDZ7662278.1 molybdopterin-binding protein [Thiohalophilus sp.]MDZ7803168.1 molybdopterin-binding protein [Thiohalophilus sp.]
MQIGILIIGDELLSGRRQDKHLAHVIGVLAQRHLDLSWARYVGDDETNLVDSFHDIATRGDLCFSFGGIGATPDDITRQCVARALNLPIVRHPGAVKEIETQFSERAYPNRIRMADLPEGAGLIPNPRNRIPGFSVGHIHCLPGFPELAWPMMEWVMENHYPDLHGAETTQYVMKIHDGQESELIALMEQIQRDYPSLKVSSLPRFLANGKSEIEMGIKGEKAEAQAACEAIKTELLGRDLEVTML